jgi:hypothetical protein
MQHGFKYLPLVALMTSAAWAGDPVETRPVSVNEMMDNSLRVDIPVQIPIPVKYRLAQLKAANFGYTYWLRPEDVKAANAAQDLPVKHGWMYAKITTDVGYDQQRNLFIGLEEPESLQAAKRVMKEISMERRQVGNHQIVLLKATAIANNVRVYGMYVATNIDTNVVYIAYRPEKNSKEIGDFVWNKLRESLSPSSTPVADASSASPGEHGAAVDAPRMSADLMQGVSDEKTIQQFARLAAEKNVDGLFNSFSNDPIRATGVDQLREYLVSTVIPFFSGSQLDTYSAINGAQFQDGTTGQIHYMYIVTPEGKYQPFSIALRNESGKITVMNILVGQCVRNRHPKAKGRCD